MDEKPLRETPDGSTVRLNDGFCDASILDISRHDLHYAGDEKQYICDGLKHMTWRCSRCDLMVYAANITAPVT